MRPGNRVTLARRYVAEDDPRAKWTLRELRATVLKEVYDGDSVVLPPWKCSAMNA
jgi:hypothetical protein